MNFKYAIEILGYKENEITRVIEMYDTHRPLMTCRARNDKEGDEYARKKKKYYGGRRAEIRRAIRELKRLDKSR